MIHGNKGPAFGGGARQLIEKGLVALRAGRAAESEPHFRAALKLDRNSVDAHWCLASALSSLGRTKDALESIGKAIKLDPARAQLQQAKGNIEFARGEFAAARASYQKACKLEPRNPNYLVNTALACERLGEVAKAKELYEQVLALEPGHARALHNLALLALNAMELERASELIDRAILAAPGIPEVWNTAGNIARARENVDRAVECFGRVIKMAPTQFAGHMNLGQVLREAGRMAEAHEAYQVARDLAPNDPHVRVSLCLSRTYRKGDAVDEDVAWLERALESPAGSPLPAEEILFALAKVYGEVGQDERAFEFLVRANALKRKTIDWSVDRARDEFVRLRAAFPRANIEAVRDGGERDATMVFVLGMPRSGTTLIEQIIASHPLAFGAGELTHLETIVKSHPTLIRVEDAAARAARVDEYRSAAREYLARVRPLAPTAARIVDKLPNNFPYCGLIASMLPEARIVHCNRDARDNCYSIFRHTFAGEQPFAYDLRELGQYYLLYEEMMAHWRAVLSPTQFHEVRYEVLLDDFDGEVRRLLAFLGLEFDERCLRFFETQRVVRTASLAQVRQPLFRSSLGVWRRYETQLAPLLEALGPR